VATAVGGETTMLGEGAIGFWKEEIEGGSWGVASGGSSVRMVLTGVEASGVLLPRYPAK